MRQEDGNCCSNNTPSSCLIALQPLSVLSVLSVISVVLIRFKFAIGVNANQRKTH
jgi:hypothetical protein